MSVHSDGTLANGDSVVTAISEDGRYVAFGSSATNLVDGDTNALDDVFVRDRAAGTTTRVSIASDGAQADGASSDARFAVDGRFVTFLSTASNLVADDANGVADVFVHDRQLGTTVRVSVASDGTEADGASSMARPTIDGRYVAFLTEATNLGGPAGWFIHDRTTATTHPLPDAAFAEAGFEDRYAFGSTCLDDDIWVFDRVTGVEDSFTPEDACAIARASSPDGRFVVIGLYYQVHLHDRQLGTTVIVSANASGAYGDAFSYGGPVTPDGRHVIFTSLARDLVDDDNTSWSIFVRDVEERTTRRVPVTTAEGPMPYGLAHLHLSEDGQHVAFTHIASFLDEFGGEAGVDGIDAHPDGVWEIFAHTFEEPAVAE